MGNSQGISTLAWTFCRIHRSLSLCASWDRNVPLLLPEGPSCNNSASYFGMLRPIILFEAQKKKGAGEGTRCLFPARDSHSANCPWPERIGIGAARGLDSGTDEEKERLPDRPAIIERRLLFRKSSPWQGETIDKGLKSGVPLSIASTAANCFLQRFSDLIENIYASSDCLPKAKTGVLL